MTPILIACAVSSSLMFFMFFVLPVIDGTLDLHLTKKPSDQRKATAPTVARRKKATAA